MHRFLWIFAFLFFISCGSDDLSNTRAYAEGKITSKAVLMSDIAISIQSESKTVAQTIPTESGSFVLSGPLFSEGFVLKFNKKVKSFSASKNNCTLSSDALSIEIPKGITYIQFNQIEME